MKITNTMLAALLLSFLTAGCASLDERLVSPDAAVRCEAYAEVLDTACKSGKWEEVEPMLDRISDQDDLEKVLFEQSHAVRLWGPRLSDEQMLQIASRLKGEDRFRRLVSKDCWSAVSGISDPAELERIATGNGNVKGRLLAVSKVKDQASLARIAKNGSSNDVRKMAVSMLTDPEQIKGIAFQEPDADLALRLLEKLPTRREYNELKRQLDLANQLIGQSICRKKEKAYTEEGMYPDGYTADPACRDSVQKQSFSFVSPWVRVAKSAQDAFVRQRAIDKIPRQAKLARTDIARNEIVQLLYPPTGHSVERLADDSWSCSLKQPLSLDAVTRLLSECPELANDKTVQNAALAFQSTDMGGSRKEDSLVERIAGLSSDRRFLVLLSGDKIDFTRNHSPLKYDADGRAVVFRRRVSAVGWGPVAETIVGICVGNAGVDSFSKTSCSQAAKSRLIALDGEEAAAEAARKAEADKREQERKLAAVREDNSAESLIRTAKTATDRKLRIAAIERIQSVSVLSDLAVNDADAAVRSAATEKIDDAEVLLDIVENDFDSTVRDGAFKRLRQVVPDRCGVSLVHKLAKGRKVSDALLSSAVSSFSNSVELRVLVSDAAVSVPIRNAALGRINDEVFLERIASSVDSPALQTAAIGKIADAEFLLSRANDRTADPSVQSAALSRLKALSQWVRIAAGLQSPSEQKEALSHIASDEERVEVVKTGNSAIVKLLAAERIVSSRLKTEIEDVVRESETAWTSHLEKELAGIQARVDSAKRTQKTYKEMESSFASEIGTSVEAAIGDVFGGKVWCSRWQDKANAALSENASLKKALTSLETPKSTAFDCARTRIRTMTDELDGMSTEQRRILDDVTGMKAQFDKMVEMFGPSIFQ